MKKILCIAVACILTTVFALATDVSAIDVTKIQNTDWDVTVTSKYYDAATGNYLASGVGRSISRIDSASSTVEIYYAELVDLGLERLYSEGGMSLNPYTYDPTTNKLKSTGCNLSFTDTAGNALFNFSGACNAVITFTSTTTGLTLSGTIKIPSLASGVNAVITVSGKKLGKYAP